MIFFESPGAKKPDSDTEISLKSPLPMPCKSKPLPESFRVVSISA